MNCDQYKNIKNGEIYKVISSKIINATNKQCDQVMIMYQKMNNQSNKNIYVMELSEFNQKCVPVDDLEKCPFCGSIAEIFISQSTGILDTYDVHCTKKDCYLEEGASWCFETKHEAISMWNNRENVK